MAVTSLSMPPETGTGIGRERRCRYCRRPILAGVRSDARFCDRACKAAARRARAHRADAIAIGFAVIDGRAAEVSRACPMCGKRFVPGHGRRRDAIYDRSSCRTAAWRARKRRGAGSQRVREAVNKTMATSTTTPLSSGSTGWAVGDLPEPPP